LLSSHAGAWKLIIGPRRRLSLELIVNRRSEQQHAEFRSQGLFVGSGVVEAGYKTVIGQRLKLSGMHWTVKGANAIIALRCCQMSNRWEEFWESRASALIRIYKRMGKGHCLIPAPCPSSDFCVYLHLSTEALAT
jgi:hypothetical protein